MLPREIIILLERYIAIPAVGWLVASGIIGQEDTGQWVEIINNVSGVVIMIVLYFVTAKKPATAEHPISTPRFPRVNALADSVKTHIIEYYAKFAYKKPIQPLLSPEPTETPQNPV